MKKLFFLTFLFFCFGCSSFKNFDLQNSLNTVIKSDEFIKSFYLCENKNDTIKIFNNTTETFNQKHISIICGKTLIVEKSNLIIDVDKPVKSDNQKIILYKIENINNKYVYTFLNDHSNINLIISLNSRNKINIIERGFF